MVFLIFLIIFDSWVPITVEKPSFTDSGRSVVFRRTNTFYRIEEAVASSWIPPESESMKEQFFISSKISK